ncbi:MAG: CD225/dispanin family protein [Prevotellaceae bacterium]|nr:CD225/dispanin family protein [Prevotellaceae bacterium]
MASEPAAAPIPTPVKPAPPSGPMPPTYLWQSIVVTIICCLPLGIPAIVYAAQVEKYFMNGDINAAHRSSRYAKNFTVASLITGLVVYIPYLIYLIFIVAAAGGSSMIPLFE